MMNKKTMFFAACVVVCVGWNNVQAEEQTQVQKELVERVHTVKSRHKVLLTSVFIYNRLGNQDKKKLTSVIKMWDMHCSKIDTEISILSATHDEVAKDETAKTFFDDLEIRLTKKVVLLERFIDALLSIRVKLEPISSCSLADYQRFLLPIYAVIVRDLSLQLRKKEIDETFNWSNDTLTTLVRQVLTLKVLGSSFWRLFSTDATTLYNNLAFDIKSFPESNDVWERYFSFLHEYMQTGYTAAIKSSCETVLDCFTSELYGEGDPALLSYITMISLKLCAIKNDLEELEAVQDLSTKKLYNIDLFMHYKTLLKKEIYYGNEIIDIVVSDFYRIVGRYFNQHPTDFVFLFQVSTLLKQLRDIHQSQTSFLSWLFGKKDTVLFEMISIVSSVEREIREVCCPESTTPGFAANIMNSSWWRSLAQTSPLLVLTLFKYLAPHVQDAFDGKLSSFLTAQENSKQPDQDQLLTFIDKNPDLFKDIATKHPELLDIVAQRLQH